MKKLTTFLFSFLLLFSLSFSATANFPMFISGTVEFNGVKYANQEIEITDSNIGLTAIVKTNENGQYQVVLNNYVTDLGKTVNSGDTIVLKACPVDLNSNCKRTVVASTDPQEVSWDIDVDSSAVSDGAIDTITLEDCPDVTCPSIPACPDVTCPSYDGNEVLVCPVCDNGTCPEIPEDEDDILGYVWWALFAVGGSVAGGYGAFKATQGTAVINKKGTGFKAYVGNDGTIKKTHKHPGTRGYHDLNNSHSPLKERHPKGEEVPQYVKDEKGEWKYVG